MTIDEAIVHAREVAIEQSSIATELLLDGCDASKYIECKEYYEQIAEWLEELKFLKQWKSDIMDSFCKYDVSSFEELVANTRNKAIDDFVTKYKFCDNRSIQCRKALNCADCIAEQLKAGILND